MNNAETVKKLRGETGAGVMECKRALEDAAGDFKKAKQFIAERGLIKAEKKAERVTGSGKIFSYIHNERIGVLLLLRCETDFVARLESFEELGKSLVMQIAAMEPETVKDFLAELYIRDEQTTVENLIKSVIAQTGENIQVEKFCRYVL
jgi:elongation factor Ts